MPTEPIRSPRLNEPAASSGGLEDTQRQNDEQRDRTRELSLLKDEPPAAIHGYAFLRRLGDGAFGSVWLAREENTGKHVAVKFYSHRRGLDWSLLSREVEKLAVLYTSRRIVGLIDVGWDTHPPYYVMEYLENGSLASYLANGPLPPNEAVRMARAALQGLVHAHGCGILHCDLKPANVLLDSDFEPRLCDFGQSRLSHEQNPALGTLFYMAAEQADLNAVPDARWDVYGLGALLYHMLCGAPPHRTPENEQQIRAAQSLEERLAVYRRILRGSPPPQKHRHVAGVDRRLADIVDRCLQVDPSKRYPNAQAVLDRLIARDRTRERRPLIALGIIGPALLIAAMAFIFVNAMTSNVEKGQELQIKAALERNAQAARIQAGWLEYELYAKLSELEDVASGIGARIANDTDFKATVSALDDTDREEFVENMTVRIGRANDDPRKHDWIQLLDQAATKSDERNAERHRGPDTSWFLNDHRGYQLWRRPFNLSTIGENYGWRDYFNGQNREDERARLPPIEQGHISIAFPSQATGRYMVAMSVPVRNAHDQIIGVLARTTHLGEMPVARILPEMEVGGSAKEQAGRTIALADTREWQLLDHPWLTEHAGDKLIPAEQITGTTRQAPYEPFALLELPEEIVQELDVMLADHPGAGSGGVDFSFEEYLDPVGNIERADAAAWRGEWLAAMSPVRVRETLWMVIVQERRADSLQPVEVMTKDARMWGMLFLVVTMSLVGPLWFFVSRALQDRGSPYWTSRVVRRNGSNGTG